MEQNKILVVDDEPNCLKAIQRLFNDSDHLLAFADNGKNAAALIPEFDPDLVILDVIMPEMDGHQLCRHIKSDPNRRHTMVLMLSGCDSLPDRMAGYRAEADGYLTKPFSPEELKAKVNVLLRLKNTQDELYDLNCSLERLVRKRTRELMEKERQALVGRMVQGIVHNLRGPLMAIQGNVEFADLLIRQMRDGNGQTGDEAVLKTVAQISSLHAAVKRVVGQAGEMLSDLLAKSRQGNTAQRSELDLNAVIREELKFLNADQEIGIQVLKQLCLHEGLPLILGTYTDFSQLIYNMVKNAADAMAGRPRRELTITTALDEKHIILAFQDTGSGIAPEHIDRIFDLYFTTKAGRSGNNGAHSSGSGIGLYTCDQIVRAYGGEIRAESEPGQGTRFTILIPRENEVCRQGHD